MKIIEDCSPYYIRFTHDNIDNIISHCVRKIPTTVPQWGFMYPRLPNEDVRVLEQYLPYNNILFLNKKRFSLFITEPGKYYGAHKDGYPLTMFSINYPIIISDSECVTSWYSDHEIHRMNYIVNRDNTTNDGGPFSDKFLSHSREVQNFNKSAHTPQKTMVAQLGEGILFNTDIYHDWDNSKSPNRRVVLTLRHAHPDRVSYDDAKQLLFDTV